MKSLIAIAAFALCMGIMFEAGQDWHLHHYKRFVAKRWYKAASDVSFSSAIDIEATRKSLTLAAPSDEDVYAITHCNRCDRELANEEITEIVNVCAACEKTQIEDGQS